MMKLPAGARYLGRPIPLGLVQAVTNAALARVLARHPKLFDRLGEHTAKSFAFTPTDLPLTFVIAPRGGTVTVLRSGRTVRADVGISGPIVTLLALAEGRLDGDAEFFARDLSIDGDMEAIIALRNAMDDCRIDLPTDLAPDTGPFRKPVEAGLQALRTFLLSRGVQQWN
ncbi:MAG TPA: SCP2 sterol-binding domain-containing protein [Devosia sp.]|jgi:predicted lipid carrier protein YhbT|uniref:ubiquinone anaerobic biosynthesis accessory factor UbiT n=1 Tax=Devosia sp. TaxID=1871048 RepID=UPI002DDD4D9D|nr:SCP2 sterol-binding domain-containing protein [Devosia sp.]HEV2515822.1 SCP2 sterol-binding domain-containing protein [Devosia sp.]